MLMDYNKWTKESLIVYTIVSMLLVYQTVYLLTIENFRQSTIVVICFCVGMVLHTGLRYFLDEMLVEILRAIKDVILKRINKLY